MIDTEGYPTVIYYNDGIDLLPAPGGLYRKEDGYTKEEFRDMCLKMKESGHRGFMDGFYARENPESDRKRGFPFYHEFVKIFFKAIPDMDEFNRRKAVGLVSPTWHFIREDGSTL